MSDEDRIDALGRLCEERFRAHDRLVMQMFTDRDKALETALVATNERLHNLNESRALERDKAAEFAQREVVDAQLRSVSVRISENTAAISRLQGRALAMAGIGGVFGAVITALVVSFLT